jgi:hypothetical protein
MFNYKLDSLNEIGSPAWANSLQTYCFPVVYFSCSPIGVIITAVLS